MGIKKGKILDFGPMRRAAEILGMKCTSLYAECARWAYPARKHVINLPLLGF